MKLDEALRLLGGNRVRIDHILIGEGYICCEGLVEDGYFKKPEILKNEFGVEYILVPVRYQGKRNLFPSYALTY